MEEIGTIFLYVAAFGFSDYLIKITKLSPIIYYTIIFILGISFYGCQNQSQIENED